MAQALRRAASRRADRRAAARAAADGHRRAGRGGDRQDARIDAEGRDALVDTLDGPRGRAHAVGGASHLEGVRAAAPSPGDLEALARSAVHRQGPRCRRALPQSARARRRAVRRREVPDPGARPHRADPADAPRHPERATHDDKRAGTSSLYAALDITTGQVIGRLHSRHRAIEFKQFLQTLDREVPSGLDVHLVLDNSSTHKTPAIQRWLSAHPRFVVHFTPTSSSWLNLVERWFAELTTKKLRRGAHRSVRQLNTDIRTWIDTWNADPKPFVWTKTADQILDSIARYCERINEPRH